MKKILFVFMALACATALRGQNVDLRGDSIRMFKNGGNAELVIRNKTRDSIGGILMNMGNGVTRYQKSRMIDPGHLLIGGDTVAVGASFNFADSLAFNLGNRNLWSANGHDNVNEYYDSINVVYASQHINEITGLWTFRVFPGTMAYLFQIASDEIFKISSSQVYSIKPIVYDPVGAVASIAGIQSIDASGAFDTGIYGEVSGGVQATKWGGTFAASGGVNNYGIEPIALGGSGINAALRITLPGTWATNNYAIRSLSLAQSWVSGPITLGGSSTGIANQFQIENWGSWGGVPDSIPTVDPYAPIFGYSVLGIDPSNSGSITQITKVKFFNGILPPTVSTVGTNVSSVTFVGHDDAFDMVVVTSGNVTGLVCTFVFGQVWDSQPYMSSPGWGSDAATMAATTKMEIHATSAAGGTVNGTITGAGTYHYNIICRR